MRPSLSRGCSPGLPRPLAGWRRRAQEAEQPRVPGTGRVDDPASEGLLSATPLEGPAALSGLGVRSVRSWGSGT